MIPTKLLTVFCPTVDSQDQLIRKQFSISCSTLFDVMWRFFNREQDVSAKKSLRRFGKFFMSKRPVLSWFCFWFSTNWLGPVVENQKQNQDYIPVCRILELKKNDKTIIVGKMQSIKRASDMSSFPLEPRGPLGPLIFPSC